MTAITVTTTRGLPKQPGQHGVVTVNWTDRRVWFINQRVHHGATGAIVAAISLSRLAAHTVHPVVYMEALLAGVMMMIDDAHDLPDWFRLGLQV